MRCRPPATIVSLARQILARASLLAGIGLWVVVSALPVSSQVSHTQGPIAVVVGDRSVNLFLPEGHCRLDRNIASDKRAIELVERLSGVANRLQLFGAECQELADWRGGKRATLGEYTQAQSNRQLEGQDFAGQEAFVIKSICDAVRQQGGQMANNVEAEIKKKIDAGKEAIKLQNVSMLGVLGEDAAGCYVGLIIGGQTDTGQAKSQLCVFANAVLNGKVVYLYHYAETVEEATLQRLLTRAKASAQRHVEANKAVR